MKRIILVLFLTLLPFGLKAQDLLGIESQAYPAGFIINGKLGWTLNENSEFWAKAGYNIARRQDFGKHDNEEGGGLGFTLAYKRKFSGKLKNWFLEGRLGTWFLDIDWRDDTPLRTGSTDITVVQPTLGVGYNLLPPKKRTQLSLFLAFGYEINVFTSGEPVGEGGISLIGISYNFGLN